MKIIRVEWIDSAVPVDTWESRGLRLKPVKIKSVGFLLKETRRAITMALSVSKTHACGRICIPKCAIMKRKWVQ